MPGRKSLAGGVKCAISRHTLCCTLSSANVAIYYPDSLSKQHASTTMADVIWNQSYGWRGGGISLVLVGRGHGAGANGVGFNVGSSRPIGGRALLFPAS